MSLNVIDTDFACEIVPGDAIVYDGSPYTVKAIEPTEDGFVFTMLDKWEDEILAIFDYDEEILIGWDEI